MLPALASPLVEAVIVDPLLRLTAVGLNGNIALVWSKKGLHRSVLNDVFASSVAFSMTSCPPLMKIGPALPVLELVCSMAPDVS